MPYAHSFTSWFYGDVYEAAPRKKPKNLADAIASMPKEIWNSMARDVFACDPEFLDVETVFSKAIETDTVGSISTPVDVWIDPEGYYTVDVWD